MMVCCHWQAGAAAVDKPAEADLETGHKQNGGADIEGSGAAANAGQRAPRHTDSAAMQSGQQVIDCHLTAFGDCSCHQMRLL
jgi:hypothetical protein